MAGSSAGPPGRRLVFLDASVLVAASHSPSGGSSVAIEVCHGRTFRAALTARVILEARTNIAEKFGDQELVRFYEILAGMEPEAVAAPPDARVDDCSAIVGRKDAHVLAAALSCGASYLLTLDRRHLITPAAESAGLPVRIVTPGDFLREIAGWAGATD